jgi:hypothetical protein
MIAKVTMQDILEASGRRHAEVPRVKVDDHLQTYLIMVMTKIVESHSKSGAFAALHTLLEIGIEAGIVAGMQEAKRLSAVPAEEEATK